MVSKARYGSFLHSAIKAIKIRVEMGKDSHMLEERWLSGDS